MSIVGSTSSQYRAIPPLREPDLILVSTPEVVNTVIPEDNNEDTPDINNNTQIKDLVNVTISRLAKVNTPLKFRGEQGKLKEFIAKLKIYYKHNLNSFNLEANKVTYAISYIEGLAFDFIEPFLLDFGKEE